MSSQFLERALKSRFLQFTLGSDDYCIPLTLVREVVPMPRITPIPLMPPYFAGLGNMRGRALPIVDLRIKLGITAREQPEQAVIICNMDNMVLGLLVDCIHSVFAPSPEQFIEAPRTGKVATPEFIEGLFSLREKMVLVINPERVLNAEERATATAAQATAA